jgi:hypothetical protein
MDRFTEQLADRFATKGHWVVGFVVLNGVILALLFAKIVVAGFRDERDRTKPVRYVEEHDLDRDR